MKRNMGMEVVSMIHSMQGIGEDVEDGDRWVCGQTDRHSGMFNIRTVDPHHVRQWHESVTHTHTRHGERWMCIS